MACVAVAEDEDTLAGELVGVDADGVPGERDRCRATECRRQAGERQHLGDEARVA